jgi:hypothetical protein
MKCSVVLTILCLSCCAFAQTKPAPSVDESCQAAIASRKPLLLWGREGKSEQLVPLITGGAIDVYTSASSFAESAQETRFGGYFWSDLILVFRDEDTRQKAIQAITANNKSLPANNIPAISGVFTTVITDARPGSYKSLKYLWMRIAYYPSFYLIPNSASSATVPGPVLDVVTSDYIEPIACSGGGVYRALQGQTKYKDVELVVIGDAPPYGEQGFQKDCTNCADWSLLAGDLRPLRTTGGRNIIRVDRQRSPFLARIIDVMEQKIAAARQNSDGKDSVK